MSSEPTLPACLQTTPALTQLTAGGQLGGQQPCSVTARKGRVLQHETMRLSKSQGCCLPAVPSSYTPRDRSRGWFTLKEGENLVNE